VAQPVLTYLTGPWSNENLVTAIQHFFQQNAYHPFAHCSHPQKHEDPVPLTEILPPSKEMGEAERNMLYFCTHPDCAGLDPGKFRSNRKEVKNMSFFDSAKAFSYRTIDPKETIRGRVKTFREFSLFVARMANRKACGDDKMPADLFKNAPEAFRKRAWILINIILSGHYICNEELLEARVIILCKDHGNPTLLANYMPIALCNAFYQLINIIITSRIRRFTEKYAVLESSQHGFRGSRSVQLVIQKERWL